MPLARLRSACVSSAPRGPAHEQAYTTARLRRFEQVRAAISHPERDETVQSLQQRIPCHGFLGPLVGPVACHEFAMQPFFTLGSVLKRNDDPAHGFYTPRRMKKARSASSFLAGSSACDDADHQATGTAIFGVHQAGVRQYVTSAVSADIVWRKGVWHCLRDEALICS